MKISEKLAELKQKEGELMRLYNLRDAVTKQGFKDSILLSGEESSEVLEKKKVEYLAKKKLKIEEMNLKIEDLKKVIVDGKSLINRKNIEMGTDSKLGEMKFLRLELSKLMNLIKKERYGLSSMDIDIDVWEELGIADRIKELEKKKSKLDAEIQSVNWGTEL